MRVSVDKLVSNDIKQISTYIAKDSEYYAKKTADEIHDKIYGLETSIYHGRMVPELNEKNIQELIYHGNYRIIFQIEEDVAHIIQVLNSRQGFNKNFRFEKLKDFTQLNLFS